MFCETYLLYCKSISSTELKLGGHWPNGVDYMTFVKYLMLLALSTILLAVPSMAAVEASDATAKLPEKVEKFRLNSHLDESHALDHYGDAKALVLYSHGVGCPIVRQSVPELTRLHKEFGEKGVAFLMINANDQDLRSDLREEADEFNIEMPILKDTSQQILQGLAVERTAEAIVVDPQDDYKIIYRGAVDDRFNYGSQKKEAKNRYLHDALVAHLDDSEITTPFTKAKGCLITYLEPEQEISYINDIAPILQEKCVTCHQKGNLGPFAMSNLRKVQGWADMMAETIRTKRMPPWHADDAINSFQHDLSLSTEQERTLLRWLEAGAPGEVEAEADPLRKPIATPQESWALGEPDLIVQLPEEQFIKAEGTIDYRYIYVPSGLTEDKWVRAAQVRVGNLAVVHHALIFIQYPEEYEHIQPDHSGGLEGYFEAFLPGAPVKPYPDNTAQFVPAGSTFVFQMHYNATGKPETDQTQMGLYFADAPPSRILKIDAAHEEDFYIPPNTDDYTMDARFRFRRDARIYGMSPHMHYRGGHAKFTVDIPGQEAAYLLNIPYYDFDWQPMYVFEEPVDVPKGTVVTLDGGWDNTRFNPDNPDPDEWVAWGEQSWEEMFIGYIKFSEPYKSIHYKPRDIGRERGPDLTADNIGGTTWNLWNRYIITLAEDGSLMADDQKIGTWEIDGIQVNVDFRGRNMGLYIRNDQLMMRGRALDRVN